MMRAILFLSLVGAGLYGFLVLTGDALTDTNSKQAGAIQDQANHSADERLSSWGSYLPSRPQSQNPQLASQQPATLPSREGNDPSQNSARDRLAASEVGAASASDSDGAKPGSAISGSVPNQIAPEATIEPLAKPSVRKSSKRSRSAKRGVAVANADPWNSRWSRRVERRRGIGLFMFRPIPNGRY
jgi:hypothetical protein